MKTTEIIGKKLAKLRLNHGYTQSELSNILKVAQTTYAGYERGKSEPSIDVLIHLASIYNTSLDYLAGRYDNTSVDELPENYIDELIYLNSDERKLEDEETIVMLHEKRKLDELISNDENQESKRGKYNRVKHNKPRQ